MKYGLDKQLVVVGPNKKESKNWHAVGDDLMAQARATGDPWNVLSALTSDDQVRWPKVQDFCQVIRTMPSRPSKHPAASGLRTQAHPQCYEQFRVVDPVASGALVVSVTQVPASTGPPERPVVDWTIDEVIQYVEYQGLGHVADKFRDNAIDGSVLVDLTAEDLCNDLGLQKLQAKKILQNLKLPANKRTKSCRGALGSLCTFLCRCQKKTLVDEKLNGRCGN